MPKRKQAKADDQAPSEQPQEPEAPGVADAALQVPEGEAEGMDVVESPDQALERVTGELEELNDRYLRLAADFDNFRKRVTKERAQMRAQSQADLVRDVLEALDDLERVTGHEGSHGNVQEVIAGVEMVERKLMSELERMGLERVSAPGLTFDPNLHEAVSALPAPSPEQDGTIAAVMQRGYRFGGVLLRPARVQVYIAMEPAGEA
jgi:molecular chaperone GrpE